MKTKLLFLLLLFVSLSTFAQIEVSDGPQLENDRNKMMNRMIASDANNYYCYRIKTKGKGTSYFIEKYNTKDLSLVFSKEINLPDELEEDQIVMNIEYAGETIFVFRRHYNKKKDEMELSYQTISSKGEVSTQTNHLMTISTDHYEFVAFEIKLNTLRNKFLIAASHKPRKDSQYETNLILFDALNGMNTIWKKTVKKNLFNPEIGYLDSYLNLEAKLIFLGLMIDEKDNLYYGLLEKDDPKQTKGTGYLLNIGILESQATTPEVVNLEFENTYTVRDIEFSKTPTNEIVLGGFLKEVIERKGRDLVNCGIFTYKVDLASKKVIHNTVKIFSPKLLADLESSPKRSRYFKYKLDYIMPIGSDVFYIGEQYSEQKVTTTTTGATGTITRTFWEYEYMDIIVAKLNAKGEFEWITNAPFRFSMATSRPQVFKQYLATTNGNSIYILRNDHPKNMRLYEERSYDPSDLKSHTHPKNSNFIYSKIDLTNGSIKNDLIFANEEYYFTPILDLKNPDFYPPEDTELFIYSNNDEIVLYTNNKGRDKFVKLKMK